jgi:hypothetical protein
MAARFVGTSRLSNIIQMVTISRQSGILRVTRNQGGFREMGQIRFIQGEAVSALLGSLSGGAALNALTVWGECMYAFDETEADTDTRGFDPAAQPMLPMPPAPASPTGPESSWPSYGYPSTSSLNSFSPPPPDYGAMNPADSLGGYPSDPYYPHSMQYGGYSSPDAPQPAQPGYSSGVTATTYSLGPEQLASRPRRTTPSMNVEQLPLDRRERMVLLLIDGQRTVMDLVRLTRRHEGDLYAVLNHLHILGLVTL